jgi:hypothetical protein
MSHSGTSEQDNDERISLRPIDVIQAAASAFNRRDIDSYLGFFDPTCRRWIVGFSEPLTLEQVGDSLRELITAFDPLQLSSDALFGDGGSVCARWRLCGTHVVDYAGIAATNSDIDVKQCEVYAVAGGLVVESWVYVDPRDLFRQMAAHPGSAPFR